MTITNSDEIDPWQFFNFILSLIAFFILRVVRAGKHILKFTLYNKARNTLSTVAICSFVLMIFATIGISIFEPTMQKNGTFWWTLFTFIMG